MKKVRYIMTAIAMVLCMLQFFPQMQANAAIDEILETQLTMPIVSIDTLGNNIQTKEEYTSAKMTIYDENGNIDTDNSDISIRLRGNVTLNLDKKSYRFKFPKKANPLNLGDGTAKSWNLVANYYDTSLLRNMTAYHLGDMLNGMPYAANCRSVEVYVNGSYQGVYLLTEAINVAKSRINIAEDPSLIENNGYLVEMSWYDCENPFYVEHQQYDVKSDLSTDTGIAEQQITYISDYMDTALKVLKSGNQTLSEQYIDIASLVDNYIANEICKNVDSGWDSYYISKDAGGKLTFHPMWDYDLALGNFIDVKGMDAATGLTVYNVSNCNANSNQWFCYAIQNDWFREAVTQRWEEVYNDIKTLPDFVTEEATKNGPSYERNFTKWNTLGKKVFSEPNEIAKLTTHQSHAAYLSTWIENRIAWFHSYFMSDNWKNGIYLDENEKPIDTKNAVAVSTLMFWGGEGKIDMDNLGFTANATSGGWGGAQALSTGLMLFRNQKYRLSFDYTAPSTANVNYRIQANHDSYTPYINGSVQADGITQHFETEFTATVDDANCAMVLEFKGSGVVQIEHLSLVALPTEPIIGDVNTDGVFNIADVILLQKWQLALSETYLLNWEAGDFHADSALDALDLSLMKSALLHPMYSSNQT